MAGKKKEDLTINEALLELDKYIEVLENRDTPIEEAFETYEKGMEILKNCNEKLSVIQQKIKLIEDNRSDES